MYSLGTSSGLLLCKCTISIKILMESFNFSFRFQELSVKFHFSSLYFKNFLGRKNFFVFTDIF